MKLEPPDGLSPLPKESRCVTQVTVRSVPFGFGKKGYLSYTCPECGTGLYSNVECLPTGDQCPKCNTHIAFDPAIKEMLDTDAKRKAAAERRRAEARKQLKEIKKAQRLQAAKAREEAVQSKRQKTDKTSTVEIPSSLGNNATFLNAEQLMSGQWYYSSNGKKVGPVSESDIRSLATTGRITASDLVWYTGQPNWIPASQVPGLFPGPPPLPSTIHSQEKAAGNKKWIVLGIIGGVLLLVFVSLQSMMNNHNRRRQEAIDFHRNEVQRSLEQVDSLFEQLEREKR